MPPQTFWTSHVIHDVVGAYYAHPAAWSEIGWGGPASPRGYVRLRSESPRLRGSRRRPSPGDEAEAARENERVR